MAEVEGGYILLSRKLVESEIWNKPPLYLKVWIYILTKAQHKPYKKFDRGELLVSIPELIDACSYKVGYRIEKPTKSQIFNILEWLRNFNEGVNEDNAKDTMINTTKTTRGMVVKVCNYNVYQDPKNYEHNSEHNGEHSTNTTIPKRQADTINKNDKNVKNDKNKDIVGQEPPDNVPYKEIVDYLNQKAGTNYRPSSAKTKTLIKARIKEDFSVEDFKKVIDIKSDEWLKNKDMVRYLRPETLFGNKFESYLNQKQVYKSTKERHSSEYDNVGF